MRQATHSAMALCSFMLILMQPDSTLAQQATLQGLGTLPGFTGSYATGVTADGGTVVGVATGGGSAGTARIAWIWSGGQMTALSTPEGADSFASGIAAGGGYVIGRRTDSSHAGRWDLAAGTFTSFGLGFPQLPSGISADGSVATVTFYRWTQAQGLEILPLNWAVGISADGSRILGLWSAPLTYIASGRVAIEQPDQSLVLPPAPTGATSADDAVMSPDGTAILATSNYWKTGHSAQFVYPTMYGRAMTTDGSLVFGTTASDDPENYGVGAPGNAVFLRPPEGPSALGCALTRMGANLDGWRLISVRGCSTDGQVMVGFGVNPSGQLEAFRTVITAPLHSVDFDGVGGLTVQDIFAYLNAWFAGDPAADFNGGGLAVQDIFDFLNAWFAGCP